jgi:hypothetical protein
MTGFLIAVTLALVALVASVWWLLRLHRRYGLAGLPPEIERLDADLETGSTRLSFDGWALDREKGGRASWRRKYTTADGLWDVVVECEGDDVVAYQARLTHARSRWMNATRERWSKTPKIIVIEGCA